MNTYLFQRKNLVKIVLLSLLSMMYIPTINAADQDPKIAWEKIGAGAMVLDVRTPEEFAEGHLANAVNIPYEQVASEFAKRNIAKDTPVVLYCRSGRRSGIAIESLSAAGYRHIYNAGSYQTLNEAKPQTK